MTFQCLKFVGKSVAMKNAEDYIKNKADIVIDSNNDDGVAIYIEEILKNSKKYNITKF